MNGDLLSRTLIEFGDQRQTAQPTLVGGGLLANEKGSVVVIYVRLTSNVDNFLVDCEIDDECAVVIRVSCESPLWFAVSFARRCRATASHLVLRLIVPLVYTVKYRYFVCS